MVKKFPALLALIASLAIVVGPVTAAPSGAGGHIVAGSAWRLNPGPEFTPRVQFTIGVQISPGNASGTYEYANVAGGTLTGSVTCGNVDGGVAVIGGHIVGGNIAVGEDFFLFLADNGAPVFGSLGPDAVSTTHVSENGAFLPGDRLGSDFPEDFPQSCPQARGDTYDRLAEEPSDWAVVLGNVVVH